MTRLLIKTPPQWACADDVGFPIWCGAPRQYRFDGQEGIFFCGQDRLESITAQFFDFRWQSGLRWGRPNQIWLDLAFVDGEFVVSQISLKKDSALNLFDTLVSLRASEISIHAEAVRIDLLIESRLIEVENQGVSEYYVVVPGEGGDFVAEDEFRKLQEFKDSGLFEWVLVGEVEE